MSQQAAPKTRSQLLTEVVRGRVSRLQRSMLGDDHTQAAAQAMLARLRRCDPSAVGHNPEVWEITLGDLPEELLGHSEASFAEMAIHAAIVLYANHQQSRREPMHASGVGLGSAVQQLARARAQGDSEFDDSVIKKFHQVALAPQWEGRLHHLKGLVSLMRGEAIPLDYGMLAADLAQLANTQNDPSSVLTRWGRSLHIRPKQDSTGESK